MTQIISAAKIEKALREALDRSGTVGEYFEDLIGDYMHFYATKRELQADLKERGAKVTRFDSKGQKQTVNNESIDQLLKVNTQMLRILTDLGIKAVEADSVKGWDQDDAL